MNAISAHSTPASGAQASLLETHPSSSPACTTAPDQQQPAPAIEPANAVICEHCNGNAPSIAFVEDLLVNGSAWRVAMANVDARLAISINRLARLTRNTSGFITFNAGPLIRARMHFTGIDDLHGARQRVLRLGNELIGVANTMSPALVSLGGGCKGITAMARRSSTSDALLEVDLIVDAPTLSSPHLVEAMIQRMATVIEDLTHGHRSATTVSDLADRKLLCAHITLDASGAAVSNQHVDTLTGRIVDLYRSMCALPGRLGIHNALILKAANSALTGAAALGSDSQREWTATVEGDMPLAVWYSDSRGRLCGRLALPLVAEPKERDESTTLVPTTTVAAVGAHQLHHAVAAIGLAQSLVSLHTHANEAIAHAELALHAHDLALLVGADEAEADLLASHLSCTRDVRFDHAMDVLDALRGQ